MELSEFKLKLQELQELRKTWNRAHIDVTPFKYQWIIKKFRYCFKDSKTYLSPTFKISSEFGETEWYLKVISRLENENEVFDLFLYPKSTTDKQHKVAAKYSFSIINYNWEKTQVKTINLRIMDNGYGFKNYIDANTLYYRKNKLLVNNNLQIVCEGCIADSSLHISGSLQLEIPKSPIFDDFAKLLKDEKFSDVTITVSEREFKVHKAILASRSPVFEAMFSHEMEEAKTGNVVVDDIEDFVFEELLRFIYTGKTLNLEKMSDQLLKAADKYALERLKVMCQNDLCNRLSIENTALLLDLADTFNAKHLKVKILSFINRNKIEVMKTNGWNTLMKSRPQVIAEALQLLLINF